MAEGFYGLQALTAAIQQWAQQKAAVQEQEQYRQWQEEMAATEFKRQNQLVQGQRDYEAELEAQAQINALAAFDQMYGAGQMGYGGVTPTPMTDPQTGRTYNAIDQAPPLVRTGQGAQYEQLRPNFQDAAGNVTPETAGYMLEQFGQGVIPEDTFDPQQMEALVRYINAGGDPNGLGPEYDTESSMAGQPGFDATRWSNPPLGPEEQQLFDLQMAQGQQGLRTGDLNIQRGMFDFDQAQLMAPLDLQNADIQNQIGMAQLENMNRPDVQFFTGSDGKPIGYVDRLNPDNVVLYRTGFTSWLDTFGQLGGATYEWGAGHGAELTTPIGELTEADCSSAMRSWLESGLGLAPGELGELTTASLPTSDKFELVTNPMPGDLVLWDGHMGGVGEGGTIVDLSSTTGGPRTRSIDEIPTPLGYYRVRAGFGRNITNAELSALSGQTVTINGAEMDAFDAYNYHLASLMTGRPSLTNEDAPSVEREAYMWVQNLLGGGVDTGSDDSELMTYTPATESHQFFLDTIYDEASHMYARAAGRKVLSDYHDNGVLNDDDYQTLLQRLNLKWELEWAD